MNGLLFPRVYTANNGSLIFQHLQYRKRKQKDQAINLFSKVASSSRSVIFSQPFRSPYYTALYYLISGLVGQKRYSLVDKWKLFDRYISNLELIPYHSSGLTLPSKFDTLQFDYVNQRLQRNIRFARKFKPSLFVFNGNAWYVINTNKTSIYTEL